MDEKVILNDVYDEVGEERTIEARIETSERGIFITLDGYEDLNGGLETVLIELANGEPQVVIWSDINKEDPTHIISLKEAKVECRNES